jgi:sulfite exporter TauE/SafE
VVVFLKAHGLIPDIAIPDRLGYGVAFLIGLVASVSTCMAVAGGLLLALATRYNESHAHLTPAARFTPHIFFNLGRILSYTGFGAAIGAVGSSFSLPPLANSILLLIAALVMLILGLQMLHIFSGVHWLVPSMPKVFARRIYGSRTNTMGGAFAFGASTFFLPCGFTQALQLYVLAQGSASTGALVMLAFSLGTLPALLSLSAVSGFATGAMRRRYVQFAGALVIVVSLASLHSAWTLAVSSGAISAPSDDANVSAAAIVDGKQIVTMSIVGLDYYPNVFKVVAGTPVEWHINSAQARGCARILIAPGLDVRTILSATEPDVVTFTPQAPGEYAFNCGMGMMPSNSRFIVVPKA